ncbi:von Willebrand factor type A [Bacteroides coprosuis DSM 18011]|uniref:von Willebrand factor type A n=1 Tax=Bacteroides coprosuis DSM 18011 TaxID=679937 RepID=F3ZQ81_9BACE|nr:MULTISPECIES: VWA domain-containing protein [Bacteroides]EGJ71747.1 von Willebrand factor type A [Bacteroides coprosuis DSM 18011]
MFRFQEPAYLYLLLLLPILAILFFYSIYKRRKAIKEFGDPDLIADLMPTVSAFRPSFKFWVLFACIGFFSILLARPQFGTKLETVEKQGIEVMIALDISNSMLAQDVSPSRLAKSKLLISKLVDELHNDKVGLILFAGDAFTQLPITNDFVSAKMFLSSISPNLIERQGTSIGKAVDLATRSFTSQEGVGRTIILITDGEDHEPGALEAVKRAVDAGIQVNVMGVGSPDGAPIPVTERNGSEYRKDNEGNVVVTKLNEEMAQEIAKAGNGLYVRVDNTNAAQKAITSEINKLTKTNIESKVYKEYDEQFNVIAWVIFLLLITELLIINKRNPLFKNLNKLFK